MKPTRSLTLVLLTSLALALAACGDDESAAGDAGATSGDEAAGTDPRAWDLPDEFTAVLGRFIGDETAPVLGSDGRAHLVYELWLTNGRQVPAEVEAIEVLDRDGEELIRTLEGEELAASAFELSTAPAEDTALEPNESVLIYVELEFDSVGDAPDRIVHRLNGTGATSPGSQEPEPISYLFAPWDISQRTAAQIAAPLAGEGWVAINGCCAPRGAHRGSVQTVNGTLLDSQRFAIDFMQLDSDGRFIPKGADPADPASWNAYDAPIYAIADGTVVETLDGLEDIAPGELPDPTTITLETVDGNHVILDLGGGVYAFYAHLQPGTLLVSEGDEVKAGDQLASLGNTGNTSAPHLHLHLMNAPSAIASDSIPYVFNSFELEGQIDPEQWYGDPSDDALLDRFGTVESDALGPHSDELPLDLRIFSFPEAGQD